MKPVKVCFASLYAYHLFNPKSESRFGGAEIQLYYLATELAKDPNFEVSFIVGDFGQPDREERCGVKLYKLTNTTDKLKYIKAIFNIVRLLKSFREIRADIFIQRAAGMETGIIGLYATLKNKKFIYMVANDEDVGKKMPGYFSNGLINRIRWKLFKFGLKKADLVFTQHDKQRVELEKNYKKKGIIRKSSYPINETGNDEKNSVLWVGKADKFIKQPEIFIELAKSLPDKKFVLVCPVAGDRNYFEELKKIVAWAKNIEFVDYVPFIDVDKYFTKAKVFVNTSSTEGFPNTFIQAAKNKTPILSLNINPDNMLEKYGIGRCAHGDFEKLKADLNDFLKNHDLWQKTAQNCYDYAKENHDLKKIVEKDKEIILSLLKWQV